jgi:hypothetical protein
MSNEFETQDIETLKARLAYHQQELEKALLDGASWKEVQNHRKIVTELSILMDKRCNKNPG